VPFPALLLRPDINSPGNVAQIYAEATGIPDNGLNVIGLPFVSDPRSGVAPSLVTEDWLEFWLDLNGENGTVPGVSDAAFVSLAPDKLSLSWTFSQTAPGIGTARMICRLIHTAVR
jgi:hypothetical protein